MLYVTGMSTVRNHVDDVAKETEWIHVKDIDTQTFTHFVVIRATDHSEASIR